MKKNKGKPVKIRVAPGKLNEKLKNVVWLFAIWTPNAHK